MDALILSCGTGGGHNAAGIAMKEQLEKRGHHVVMMNPYRLKSDRLASAINGTYIKLAQKIPTAFGLLYRAGMLYRRLPFASPIHYLNGKMGALLQDYLKRNHFDVIIMPHIFPAQILSNMRNNGLAIPKTIYIATDYTCIPFTEEATCDAYVIPHKKLAEEFSRYGVPTDKIHALGIPVLESFSEPMSKNQAAKLLNLDPNKEYILISGGSMGAGKIEHVIRILLKWRQKDIHRELIVLCGSNHKLYKKLKRRYKREILLQEYTDKMAAYMKASEMIVTKPGGLCSTESAVSGLPILHITPIPGCENSNMSYFSQHGMSIAIRHPQRELLTAVLSLQDDKRRLFMTQKQKKNIHPHAALDICKLAEQLVQNKVEKPYSTPLPPQS
ncbi:MAG: hypothetical protein HFI37_08715 [Lachnospiraceae bacterium]|jgi:processive 1,2-diacylglycerol beta-glucosyltransferase|nr:hypothetical protein [Lachnospiraceae bacterium]